MLSLTNPTAMKCSTPILLKLYFQLFIKPLLKMHFQFNIAIAQSHAPDISVTQGAWHYSSHRSTVRNRISFSPHVQINPTLREASNLGPQFGHPYSYSLTAFSSSTTVSSIAFSS